MSRKQVVLVTGASGEVGNGLIHRLAKLHHYDILALDLRDVDDETGAKCQARLVGDILDQRLLGRLGSEFEIHAIFHLAALLSTRSEFTPETAHEVNVMGTLNLLKLAVEQSRSHGGRVKFLFPSSIAVYGVPSLAAKASSGPVREREFTEPTTMYGCNKLYCEHLGRYYGRHYRQLAAESDRSAVDFRSLRFPGLISAFTVPHGGTSDYAPEMIHAAAKGEEYACFVREDSRIPFMAMPDAIDALMALMEAPTERLSTSVYNVTAYSPSAGEFAELTRAAFPGAKIRFAPDVRRQGIVDSWPAVIDDAKARADWGFAPSYDLKRTFDEYLVPNIRARYSLGGPLGV
ncbi:MAG: NAD-dependent epimerase/dehydratase family protein [Deltaproteobacteria bacterium]|nr:NAD-dependent epimerase/dehydratase family protein [Deltaproteobacteria bacterium]